MGRSGSGKSTLLRLAAGLLDGGSGRIVIGGADMAGVPVWRREVGMVFQHYALFPNLSVADNVAYGLKMRGVAADVRRRRARDMLERVGLAAHAERGIAMLSGGQQQRVALARALVIEPKLLLLDEPLAALDAGIRHQLRDEIRALQRACGATTLLVTHDRDEALSMADRVAIVDGGRVLQVGTPRDLYERPASAQVARFVGHSTLLRGRVTAHDTVDVVRDAARRDRRAPTGHRGRGAGAARARGGRSGARRELHRRRAGRRALLRRDATLRLHSRRLGRPAAAKAACRPPGGSRSTRAICSLPAAPDAQ